MRFTGESDKFLTVVSNLETGEPLWFGQERKKETLDEFFRTQLKSASANALRRPVWTCGSLPLSLRSGFPDAASSMKVPHHPSTPTIGRRGEAAEFFRKGGKCAMWSRKKWLLLSAGRTWHGDSAAS